MAHYNERVRSYRKARDVMARKGSQRYRDLPGVNAVRLGYSTFLVENGDTLAIRQHDTDVVTYTDSPLSVILCTGGWNTVTTLERLQTFTPSVINVLGRNIHSRSRTPIITAQYDGRLYDLSPGDKVQIFLHPEHNVYE